MVPQEAEADDWAALLFGPKTVLRALKYLYTLTEDPELVLRMQRFH